MNDSNTYQEASDESMDSSESEEEGLVPLQRPLFLKRPAHQKGDDDGSDRDAKRRQTPMQKVEHENQSLKAREDAHRLLGTNYSSEQDIIRRALLLDDDDSRDPELERQLWMQRKETRWKARRDKLVAQQLEWEAYEFNRQHGDKQPDTAPAPVSSSTRTNTPINKNRHFRPERVKVARFGSSRNPTEDTEYSVL